MAETWRDRERASCRRPIEAWEVPALEAIGVILRTHREARGLSRPALATLSGCSKRSLDWLENGVRRARAEMLWRLLVCITADPAAELAHIVIEYGEVLAPASDYADRIQRRRERRERKATNEATSRHLEDVREFLYLAGRMMRLGSYSTPETFTVKPRHVEQVQALSGRLAAHDRKFAKPIPRPWRLRAASGPVV